MIDSLSDLALVARAALAAALGFIIGWERERKGSPAGDRTYAMISLGAASFTAIGVDDYPDRAAQIIAGVVTGVGFLGAGVIMRQATGEVRGLTTAASMWAVASIGVVVGTGDYIMGVLLAALIFLILAWYDIPLLGRIGHARRDARGFENAEREDQTSPRAN